MIQRNVMMKHNNEFDIEEDNPDNPYANLKKYFAEKRKSKQNQDKSNDEMNIQDLLEYDLL